MYDTLHNRLITKLVNKYPYASQGRRFEILRGGWRLEKTKFSKKGQWQWGVQSKLTSVGGVAIFFGQPNGKEYRFCFILLEIYNFAPRLVFIYSM